ncbi:MAG TPA: MFS transporter [Verrucomicrobiae bacterium]|nr:MFS transporter [Verrucomicrobiae bacterium]
MKVRWRMAMLVSVAIAISYLDRQTLPVAIKAIEQDIPVTNQQFSLLQTAFLITYALMYAGGGKLMDVLGTRRGFTLIMVFWSLACAGHGLAANFAMLAACRLLLGAGEGGGFPAATRAVAEWFPVKERSTAMGIMNAGTAIGMIVAPPLIALVLSFASWRWIFFITGATGLIWTLWWRRDYFPPEQHPKLGDAERKELQSVMQPADAAETKLSWLQLLRFRQTWGVVVAKFLSDAAWYFYLFWLPKYLYDARGFDIKAVGTFAWIPPAAAGIGCLVGGWFSSWLLHRQLPLNRARKIALAASAIVMPLILFVPNVPVAWAIALFSVAYFGQQSWSTLVMILPTDIFPKNAVGSVAGLVGFGGAMGGVVFGQAVGYLLDHGHGWGVVFALAGSFHVVAFMVICVAIPSIQPLKSSSQQNVPAT